MNKTLTKTLFFSNICLLLVVCMLSSCTTNNDNLDEALLIGKWQLGTLYETYSSDHTYTTWDTADDVTEAEAQKGEWTLEKSTLTQIHIMEMTGEGTIPKVYAVLVLDATTLVYEDDYGNKKTFTKVSE